MKKGYLINKYPALITANFDYVYINAMYGETIDAKFYSHWDKTNTLKRGLVHQPALSANDDER